MARFQYMWFKGLLKSFISHSRGNFVSGISVEILTRGIFIRPVLYNVLATELEIRSQIADSL